MSMPRGLTKAHHYLQLLPVLIAEALVLVAVVAATHNLIQQGVAPPTHAANVAVAQPAPHPQGA